MSIIKNPVTAILGGEGIDGTTTSRYLAGEQLPANVFVSLQESTVLSGSSPVAIPGAYAEYYDDNGTIKEGSCACAVIWMNENEFITIGGSYTGDGQVKQNLQVKHFLMMFNPNLGEYSVTLKNTYSNLNWYPSHFDVSSSSEDSPAIYPLGHNFFAVSYPHVLTEGGTTYNGVFEVYRIDNDNKTVSLISLFDLGAQKHAVPVDVNGALRLAYYRNGSIYLKGFTPYDDHVYYDEDANDLEILDLSSYSDIQSASSVDIDLFSVGVHDITIIASAKVTTTPATSNYICSTATDLSGNFLWSGRTALTSFLDHYPYPFAYTPQWNDPTISVIGQKDSSTFLTLSMSPYDYSTLAFSDLQMRNASNGYEYRGGLWGNPPYYTQEIFNYGSYLGNNQVGSADIYDPNPFACNMFPSSYEGESYGPGTDLEYNFMTKRAIDGCTAIISITKAYVTPTPQAVVGTEVSRCFMTVFGIALNRALYRGYQGSCLSGVSRSSGDSGDFITVEIPM